MPTNTLNLSRLNVERVKDDEHDHHIYANSVVNPTTCPNCQSARLVGFGRNQQLIKDLPMHGKRVGIYFDTRRYRCNDCSRTLLEQHPDFHPDHTFSSLAEETGVVEGTIRNIFQAL